MPVSSERHRDLPVYMDEW